MELALSFKSLLDGIIVFFIYIYNAFLGLFTILTLPATELSNAIFSSLNLQFVGELIEGLLVIVGEMAGADVTIGAVLIGGALPVYIGYQLVKWVIDILP